MKKYYCRVSGLINAPVSPNSNYIKAVDCQHYVKDNRKTVFGLGRVWLWEQYKLSIQIAYGVGWLIGFFRGAYLLYPQEETIEQAEAREMLKKHIERIEEIFKK